mmetsp:Transcript_35428/g.54209  ORF Transcript_35428/g.54209 Transcript_35428/m.54209 type:complete len:92 (+) Transcript_35428:145-420(+)
MPDQPIRKKKHTSSISSKFDHPGGELLRHAISLSVGRELPRIKRVLQAKYLTVLRIYSHFHTFNLAEDLGTGSMKSFTCEQFVLHMSLLLD